jgi:hypothetical protein
MHVEKSALDLDGLKLKYSVQKLRAFNIYYLIVSVYDTETTKILSKYSSDDSSRISC